MSDHPPNPTPPPNNHRRTPPLVRKLWDVVNDPCHSDVITWSDSTCFIILDVPEFTAKVLPRLLKVSNYAIFQRQLAEYGFVKDPAATGREIFAHEKFRRACPHLLKQVCRRKKGADLPFSSGRAGASSAAAASSSPTIQELVMQLAMLQLQAAESRAMVEAVRQEVISSQRRQTMLQDLTHQLAAEATISNTASATSTTTTAASASASASQAYRQGGQGQVSPTVSESQSSVESVQRFVQLQLAQVHSETNSLATSGFFQQQQQQQQGQLQHYQQYQQQVAVLPPPPQQQDVMMLQAPGNVEGHSPLGMTGSTPPQFANAELSDILTDIPDASSVSNLTGSAFIDDSERRYWESYLDKPHL